MRLSVSPLTLVAVTCFSGAVIQAQQAPVASWVTTTDEHGIVAGLEKQPNLAFEENAPDNIPAINVNEKVTYQRMEGGGADFTDGAAWLMYQKVSPVQREEVMKRLFDPVDGLYDTLPANTTVIFEWRGDGK